VVQSTAGRYTAGYDWMVNSTDAERLANRQSLVVVAPWVMISQATWDTSWGAYSNTYKDSTITIAGVTQQAVNHKFDLRQPRGVKYYFGNQTVFAGSAQRSMLVTHDGDGTKQISVSCFINGNSGTNFTSGSANSTFWLQQIIATFSAPASITFDTPIIGSDQMCSWASVANASSYRLEYTLNSGPWTLETTTANTSYTVPKERFNSGGTIRYRVKVEAKTGWNESVYTIGIVRTIDPGFGGIAINGGTIGKMYIGSSEISIVIYGTSTIWEG
jgi:hypothetical protein